MAEIAVKHLGLAAFVKMNDVPLVRVEDRVFIFESDRTAQAWRYDPNTLFDLMAIRKAVEDGADNHS